MLVTLPSDHFIPNKVSLVKWAHWIIMSSFMNNLYCMQRSGSAPRCGYTHDPLSSLLLSRKRCCQTDWCIHQSRTNYITTISLARPHVHTYTQTHTFWFSFSIFINPANTHSHIPLSGHTVLHDWLTFSSQCKRPKSHYTWFIPLVSWVTCRPTFTTCWSWLRKSRTRTLSV